LLLSAAVGEGLCRWLFRDVTTTAQPSYFMRRWLLAQSSASNHLGFREREFSSAPAAGTYRIAVVGDSFTYGQGIEKSERLTEQLEQRLRGRSGQVEVLNFGRLGASSLDHLRILHDAVIPSQPHYVLLQWFVNDPEWNTAGRPVPWRLLPSDRLRSWLGDHSALYFLAEHGWYTLQTRLGLVESNTRYLERRFADPNTPDARAGDAAVEAFFGACRERGLGVGMILFPLLEEVGGDRARYSQSALIDRTLALCVRNGVTCLDLRPTFAAVQPAQRLWANRFDNHPGHLANELAADAVAGAFAPQWHGAK
jgi:hypothetical protein